MATIAIVPKQVDNNHMARMWSHGRVAAAAGHDVHLVTDAVGELWAPLRDEILAAWSVGPVPPQDTAAVMCAVPLPEVVDEAGGLARSLDVPLLVDCDEGHFEARYGDTRLRRLEHGIGRLLRGTNPLFPYRALRRARRHPVIFSNPYATTLLTPAAVIPHVREVAVDEPPALDDVVVAFVGTPRPHKGVDWLREECVRNGHRLVVTADRPPDATSNEEWIGQVPRPEVGGVLARCNVVALPSQPSGLGRTQLPAKAIEAMSHGLAVVASDLPPMRWALGDAATYFVAGDRDGFRDAMAAMTPVDASRMGRLGLQRVRRSFTPQSQAGTFDGLLGGRGEPMPLDGAGAASPAR